MSDKIQLRFKLNDLEKIGFSANSGQQELLDWIKVLQTSGISVKSYFADLLCINTISHGHSLLRSKDIYDIDSSVISPMGEIIGQYLFRLVFGADEFRDYLYQANREGKRLEILLEFDPKLPQTRELMDLPWEMMYCPDLIDHQNRNDVLEKGFFVSQRASIYRQYKNIGKEEQSIPTCVDVSVAFLVKDLEDVEKAYLEYKEVAKKVSSKNPNIRFQFLNHNKENDRFDLLGQSQVGSIFQEKAPGTGFGLTKKIIHLVCDMTMARNQPAFYFKKNVNQITEPVTMDALMQSLFTRRVLDDRDIRLYVLQAWNDDDNAVYNGFEDFSGKIIAKTEAAVFSMPYLLNRIDDRGMSTFFETLYRELSRAQPLDDVAHEVRKAVVPYFAYGFPLLYQAKEAEILVPLEPLPDHSEESVSQQGKGTAGRVHKEDSQHQTTEKAQPVTNNFFFVGDHNKTVIGQGNQLNSDSTVTTGVSGSDVINIVDKVKNELDQSNLLKLRK